MYVLVPDKVIEPLTPKEFAVITVAPELKVEAALPLSTLVPASNVALPNTVKVPVPVPKLTLLPN